MRALKTPTWLCLLLLLAVISTPASAEKTQVDPPSMEIKTAKVAAVPAKPTAAGTLSAPPAVASSAACCLRQCAGGGTCGKDCEVVDKLSQCTARNFKFECPAGKGMTCLQNNCSCE